MVSQPLGRSNQLHPGNAGEQRLFPLPVPGGAVHTGGGELVLHGAVTAPLLPAGATGAVAIHRVTGERPAVMVGPVDGLAAASQIPEQHPQVDIVPAQIVQVNDVRVKFLHPADERLGLETAAEARFIQEPCPQHMTIYAHCISDAVGVFLELLRHIVPPVCNFNLMPPGFQSLRQIRADAPGAASATGYIYHQNLHIILFLGKAPPTAAPAER